MALHGHGKGGKRKPRPKKVKKVKNSFKITTGELKVSIGCVEVTG